MILRKLLRLLAVHARDTQTNKQTDENVILIPVCLQRKHNKKHDVH